MIRAPSGETATPRTELPPARRVNNKAPVPASQTRALPSLEAVAMRRPFGKNATDFDGVVMARDDQGWVQYGASASVRIE